MLRVRRTVSNLRVGMLGCLRGLRTLEVREMFHLLMCLRRLIPWLSWFLVVEESCGFCALSYLYRKLILVKSSFLRLSVNLSCAGCLLGACAGLSSFNNDERWCLCWCWSLGLLACDFSTTLNLRYVGLRVEWYRWWVQWICQIARLARASFPPLNLGPLFIFRLGPSCHVILCSFFLYALPMLRLL